MDNIKEYNVFLSATSNQILSEKMDNGEIIKGKLYVNAQLHELIFAFNERIAFKYSQSMMETDKSIVFSDDSSYYSFSVEEPETIMAVI